MFATSLITLTMSIILKRKQKSLVYPLQNRSIELLTVAFNYDKTFVDFKLPEIINFNNTKINEANKVQNIKW
jgi:hypothetical protein